MAWMGGWWGWEDFCFWGAGEASRASPDPDSLDSLGSLGSLDSLGSPDSLDTLDSLDSVDSRLSRFCRKGRERHSRQKAVMSQTRKQTLVSWVSNHKVDGASLNMKSKHIVDKDKT